MIQGKQSNVQIATSFFECDKDLKEHNSKCHNEDLMCNICGKNFNTRWKFVNHNKMHNTFRKKYVCEFDGCDERFEKYSRLIAHLNKTYQHKAIPLSTMPEILFVKRKF